MRFTIFIELFVILLVAVFVGRLWRQALREDAEMRRLTNQFLARLEKRAEREKGGNHDEL